MKKFLSMALALVLSITSTSLACFASAANEPQRNVYDEIVIMTAATTDENGNVIIQEKTLADCEYFDGNGNQVDASEALNLTYSSDGIATRSAVTHNPDVSLNSGYMMRYGDYYCKTVNAVTLSCKLGSSAKVAFGFSYTSDPNSGAEKYAATSDSKTHETTFSVPSDQYYMFYCTNISPNAVTLKTFTISY